MPFVVNSYCVLTRSILTAVLTTMLTIISSHMPVEWYKKRARKREQAKRANSKR